MGAFIKYMHVYRVFNFPGHSRLVHRVGGAKETQRGRIAENGRDTGILDGCGAPPNCHCRHDIPRRSRHRDCLRTIPPSSESKIVQRSFLTFVPARPSYWRVLAFNKQKTAKETADRQISSCSVATGRAPHPAALGPAGCVPPRPASAPDVTNSRARAPCSASRRGALADFLANVFLAAVLAGVLATYVVPGHDFALPACPEP